jgi:hypothetical protein
MQDKSGRLHKQKKQKQLNSPIKNHKTAIETKLALRSISNISLSQLSKLQGHDEDCSAISIESISDNISLISASNFSNMDLQSENTFQGADINDENEDSEIYKFFKNQNIGLKHAGLVLETSKDTADMHFEGDFGEHQLDCTPKASSLSGHPNTITNIKADHSLIPNTTSKPLPINKNKPTNQRLFKVFQDLQAGESSFKKNDINNPFEVANKEFKPKTVSGQSTIVKRRVLSEYNPQKRLFEQSDSKITKSPTPRSKTKHNTISNDYKIRKTPTRIVQLASQTKDDTISNL